MALRQLRIDQLESNPMIMRRFPGLHSEATGQLRLTLELDCLSMQRIGSSHDAPAGPVPAPANSGHKTDSFSQLCVLHAIHHNGAQL